MVESLRFEPEGRASGVEPSRIAADRREQQSTAGCSRCDGVIDGGQREASLEGLGKCSVFTLLGAWVAVKVSSRAALSLAFDRATRPKVEVLLHYAYTKSGRQGASHATWPMTTRLGSFF